MVDYPIIKSFKNMECKHENIVSQQTYSICYDCGEMLSQDMVHEPEWNNYGNKEYEDMCRVQFRKEHDKGISKELEKYSFSSEIISLADKMYTQVTKGGIKRGRSRVALIFSCVFNAYIELGNTKTSEELRKVFKLERRDASRALTDFRKEYNSRKSLFVSPEYFIPMLLKKFNASDSHTDRVISVYNFINTQNITEIKGSNPKSISAGIIYYYLFLTNKLMDLDLFSEKSGLSKITISKIYKIIQDKIDEKKIRDILKI